jgi:hypothetical protein
LYFSQTKNQISYQAAVYGVGVCAEFGGSVFKPLVGGQLLISVLISHFIFVLHHCYNQFFSSTEALSRLNAVITHPNARDSDNVMAYDNAVSALGKICQFHRDSINAAQVHHTCF